MIPSTVLKIVKTGFVCFLLLVIISCSQSTSEQDVAQDSVDTAEVEAKPTPAQQRPLAIENGKIFQVDGKKMLYGGEQDYQHFDISNCSLKDEQFHYGIGREKFPALIDPQFITVTEADQLFKADDRFLLLSMGNETKAYSIKDLTRHEVVNDVINDKPVMAAYCILADLGAIYSRDIGGKTFTFALTGYTYFDPEVWDGLDGFVFWDRETESMWWPLIGESVSGVLKGTPMEVLDEQYWSQTDWGTVRELYPQAQVLQPDQPYEPPTNWPRYQEMDLNTQQGEKIAPRWGENQGLKNS